MRISGGSARGRKVGLRKAFATRAEGDELRPTSSKVRKAIFDILGPRIIDSRFLDLYAGSGAVGIEALSRDAAFVQFVEEDSRRAAIIRDTVGSFGFGERASVMTSYAAHYLRKAKGDPFDIIFLDPPYGSKELENSMPFIADSQILKEGGRLVVEHNSKRVLPADIPGLGLLKTYRYGDTALTVFVKSR